MSVSRFVPHSDARGSPGTGHMLRGLLFSDAKAVRVLWLRLSRDYSTRTPEGMALSRDTRALPGSIVMGGKGATLRPKMVRPVTRPRGCCTRVLNSSACAELFAGRSCARHSLVSGANVLLAYPPPLCARRVTLGSDSFRVTASLAGMPFSLLLHSGVARVVRVVVVSRQGASQRLAWTVLRGAGHLKMPRTNLRSARPQPSLAVGAKVREGVSTDSVAPCSLNIVQDGGMCKPSIEGFHKSAPGSTTPGAADALRRARG
jgi:hypothetical protein